MNCIWLIVLQIAIYFIICIDSQRSWWTDELDDSNLVAGERKSVHRHRHHHQMKNQSVRRKFMADEAANGDFPASPDRGIDSDDREFRNHHKMSNRNGHRQPNKKPAARRGQRQKHNKNVFVADMEYSPDTRTDEAIGGLWPPIFNIAPKAVLYANATCGQPAREEFCHTIDAHPLRRQRKAKCGFCDANNTERRHPIEHVIDGSAKWWQSPTLASGGEYEFVTVTLDLKQIYQVIFVSLKSAITPRPASWILERSLDGNDYYPWQYFGASDDDCQSRYNLPGQNEPYNFQSDSAVICSTKFAKAIPLENGEIHLSLMQDRPATKANVTSTELLDFTLARYIGARLDCGGHANEAKDFNSKDVIECNCAHNTCGVNCEKCCPLYNQRPYKAATYTDANPCEQCECYGHATECYYNPEVDQRGLSINTDGIYSGGGVCLNCSDFTTGINCDKCISNYYRPHGVLPGMRSPCIACECNAVGSVGVCAPIGGTCTCKEGFVGPKCDQCASGYSGVNCTKCACDARGTMPGGECESHCQCKLHVEGQFCSKCISGYFGLTADNPEGCMKCYCSGVGTSCESSNIVTRTYETLEDWRVTDISKSLITVPSRDNDTGFLVFGMYELPDTESVYWLAPDPYVGNILQNYGSTLEYSIAWVIVRGDTSGKPTTGPSIVLIGENGMKIAYGDMTFSESNATISIPLIEDGWYHVPRTVKDIVTRLRRTEYRGDPVTRIQFMSVLSNVESMLLRGTFHTDQIESVLSRALWTSRKEATTEITSNLVEQCKCPIGYSGLSCETCEFGYVRVYENSTAHDRIGKCLPCSCNGHAETCDLETNRCGECLHNTIGDRCDKCANGFYGNALCGTPDDCKRCACPLVESSNNFSPSCQLRESFIDFNEVTSDYGFGFGSNVSSDYVCTQCPEGHAGDHCESCDNGYYGEPTKVGSHCVKCACNGGPCDSISGRCITCQGNTEGWRCERCKSGYYGEPAKGCELCRCHGSGSENNNICDSLTGQCKCKERYSGHQCDKCEFGFANISLNCAPCDCNTNGSLENFCDTESGQCPCKMGVTGLQCDECLDEYYELTSNGCNECRCNPYGSLNRSCDKYTGQCFCRGNVTGRTCDKCIDGFWDLQASRGCVNCQCNPIGSRDSNCSQYTGQCNCKPGVGGLACDVCLDGFYGLSIQGCKKCDACANAAYNCDPESGRCVCPPLSKGVDCQQCYPNAWGWQHKKGCQICDCDHSGAIGQSCDLYSGQCVCREGFTGRRCDQCATGYFGYPACDRCNCNRDGSISANSSQAIACDDRGQCPCKRLVQGVKCDQCHPMTFGLMKSNADGCTQCFCFGRSTECRQSDLSWGQIRMGGARSLNVEYQNQEFIVLDDFVENQLLRRQEVDIQRINGLALMPGVTGNITIGSSRGFEEPFYFQLSKQFLGDRIGSYAGYLRFSIAMEECKTALDESILQRFPLVQIHSHDNLILNYFGPDQLNTMAKITYNVRFTEDYWRLSTSIGEQDVNRAIFMAALQNVKNIFIRGTTSVAFTRVVLANVTLDTSIFLSGSTNNIAIGVEVCRCPVSYNGTSCHNPADGYYRWKEETTLLINETIIDFERFVGRAEPCDCNGRSQKCNKETGECERCAENAGGAKCERCAEGFYGEPDGIGCQSCPCPETQRNFARGCTFQRNRVSCICKPGYVGDLCEQCDVGYFGMPDAVDGSCVECDCDPNGVVSGECDRVTGQCRCKDGVTGRRCDKCNEKKSILKDGHCQVCDNCTLTLLASADDLTYLLESEAKHIDLSGIPAPWPRLLQFENISVRLDRKLDDFLEAKNCIEDYNESNIEKLLSKASSAEKRIQKIPNKLRKRQHESETIREDATKFFAEIKTLQNDIQERIYAINRFGSGNHHVNLPIAMEEATLLLESIGEIGHHHSGIFVAHECAAELYDQWANTSAVLHNQVDETKQLKYDVINLKNRLYDAMQNAHKTLETLGHGNKTHFTNRKRYENLLQKHKHISNLRYSIRDIFNTSIVPQTDTLFEIISDQQSKVVQDLKTIVRLKDVVHETNVQCAQNLRNIRDNWLPEAKAHSIDLVVRAEEYAKLFRSTKNGAEMALMASTAHKNISESIESARRLATEAIREAEKSELELFPSDGASTVIEKSLASLQRSQRIEENAVREIDKVAELDDTLRMQMKKVDSMENIIWQTGLRNNNISSTLNSLADNESRKFLNATIETSKKISDQMREVRREAVDISSDVFKLKLKLASLEPQWAVKFGLAEENVSQSLRNIKDVKNTLNNIETVSAKNDEKFQAWNRTMSASMQELRDKIAKARHIAEGIRISMESKTTKCIRSYVPASFGLSTSNTIKLSIALNTKTATSPILFVQGEDNKFLAIEMVKRKIRFVWNLGGDTASVTHPLEINKKDPVYDEAWYHIEANRTMNLGSLHVRQMGYGSYTNVSPKLSAATTAASQPDFTRFIVVPNNRVWIGGVPSDIRPSELLANDAGLSVVLNQVYIDEKQIGLWHFTHSEGECGGAMLGAHENANSVNTRHFNGQGYAVVTKERSKPYRKNFFALQMAFKTLDENALLFLAVDEKNNRSVSLTMHEGKILFRIDYGGESKLEINTTKRYNTGKWISVEAAREFTSKRNTENGSLKVNGEEPRTGSPTSPITAQLLPDLSNPIYYLGGVPPGFKSGTTKAPGADHAYLGCMRDVQINGETYDPLESSLHFGVETSCKETITSAGFYGHGYMELPSHSLRKRANFGFVFRTLQLDCLLLLSAYPPQAAADDYFDSKDLRSNYSVALMSGRLHLWLDAGRGRIELTSNNTLNDGEFHVVSVTKAGRKIELRIDDQFEAGKSFSAAPFSVNMAEDAGGLYLGGVPDYPEYDNLSPSFEPLEGAIKDVVFNNRTVSFDSVLNFTKVDIGRDGPAMGYHGHYNDILMKTEPIGKSFTAAPEGCHRVGVYSYEANAFKFGDGPFSHSIINIPIRHLWQNSFNIQFDFRTFYPNGVLFLAPGTKEKQKHFVALMLRNGQLNLLIRGRKRIEMTIPRKLNDGQWHRVILNGINKMVNVQIQIGTDSQTTVADTVKMPRRISASNMMYIGGISDNVASLPIELQSKLEQFRGCIRRFKVNNSTQDLARPGRHVNIGQCFPKVEKGSYFPGDAYAIFKRIFHVGKYLELQFEFKTSELNGVLLSVAEPIGFPALSIEMHNGKIMMSCDLGDGNPFRVETSLRSKFALCDNQWHNVSAMYDTEQVALRIDNQPSIIALAQHRSTGKVHTKSPLYIGGLPDTAPSGTLLSRENFKGCIRNVAIRDELKDWTDMDELQNVLLGECLAVSGN